MDSAEATPEASVKLSPSQVPAMGIAPEDEDTASGKAISIVAAIRSVNPILT
jgi:hypothetical protein